MSKATVRIAYDGDAFREHKIDVRDLAPSMLGLADIFVESNRVFNGEEARINVFVVENFEENCFDFGLQIAQTWVTVKSLLRHDDTLAAKDLLELVVLGGTVVGAPFVICKGVISAFRAIRGRKPKNIVRVNLAEGKMTFRYEFDSGKPVVLDAPVHALYQNSKVRRAFQRVFNPILEKPGSNKFVAYKRREERQEVSSEEARAFDFRPDDDVGQEGLGTERVQAWLRVYAPVYDLKAESWRFWYGQERHYMDVSESNIAKVVLDNGGALTSDLFKVDLEITQTINHKGEVVNKYKVKEVLEFRKGSRQADLFFEGRADEQDDDE